MTLDLVSVSEKLLRSNWRQYVIEKVKYPLMMAIILAAKRLPIRPTKANCRLTRTHNMIEIWEEFWENYDCLNRKELFKAFEILSLVEIEHDEHYSEVAEWFIKKIVERVNDGRWVLQLKDGEGNDLPRPKFWKGTRRD